METHTVPRPAEGTGVADAEVTKRKVDASRPKIGRMVGQVCRVTAIRAVGTVQSCSDRTRSRVKPGTARYRCR